MDAESRAVMARAIGRRIREMRLARGWSRAELARRTDILGPNITRAESGAVLPTLDLLARFAEAFGTSCAVIVSAADVALRIHLHELEGDPSVDPQPQTSRGGDGAPI